MASRAELIDRISIAPCKIGIRVVPERRDRSHHKRGIELIINRPHLEMVLAEKARAL